MGIELSSQVINITTDNIQTRIKTKARVNNLIIANTLLHQWNKKQKSIFHSNWAFSTLCFACQNESVNSWRFHMPSNSTHSQSLIWWFVWKTLQYFNQFWTNPNTDTKRMNLSFRAIQSKCSSTLLIFGKSKNSVSSFVKSELSGAMSEMCLFKHCIFSAHKLSSFEVSDRKPSIRPKNIRALIRTLQKQTTDIS